MVIISDHCTAAAVGGEGEVGRDDLLQHNVPVACRIGRPALEGIPASLDVDRGNCWDNAPVESFFGKLKTEWVHGKHYATREQARLDVFKHLELFYNRKRRHAALDYPITWRPAMTRRNATLSLTIVLVFAALAPAAPDPKVPPITRIEKVTPKPSAFKASGRRKPIVLRSEKEAAKRFSEDELAKLTKQVDFGQQLVLLFAWRGSGQDRLRYAVAESYPEQVLFTYKAGRTRDLRPHVYVYTLRSNVKWSVKKGR